MAMASFLDDIIGQVKDYEDLDEEKATRSIVVSNIPPEVRGEELAIHFQKSKHGGGDIDRLCMVEADGNAVIIFDEADVAKSVLEKEQILKKSGKKLTVQAFHVARPPEVPEVFLRVSARLNSEIFPPSGYADFRKLLRRIEAETEVDWHEACDGFIISGSFEQLQNAYQQLNRHLHRAALQKPEIQREFSSKGARAADNSETEIEQKQMGEGGDEEKDKYEEEVVEETPPFDVEPRFMKFLERVYREKLREMVERFSVQIEWPSSGKDTKAFIKAMPGCQVKDYNDAYESFIALYQKLHSNMKQEAIVHDKDQGEVETVTATVEEKFPVVVFKTADQVLVYGSKESVHAATKMVKSQLGLEQDTRRRKVRNSSADGEDGPRLGQTVAPLQPYPPVLQQVLPNGVRLSVYQEDITNVLVDVIVNAANAWLKHDVGVAKAIQDKGGREIFEESQAIMFSRAWKPLAASDAVVTSGGQLRCSAVIHVVGPAWGQQNNERSILLLHTAVINSLRLAASHGMRSIAFPAISSGSCGMPKELSAKAMFDAVEEYSRSVEARQFLLCDVNFVIIDLPTVDVFKHEFVKRFGEGTPIASNAWQPQVLTAHSNTGEESYPFQGQRQTYSRMSSINMPPSSVNQVYDQPQMESVRNFGAQQQYMQSYSLPYGRQDPRMPYTQAQGTFLRHGLTSQTLIGQYGQSYYSNTNVPNTSPEMNQPPPYYAAVNEKGQLQGEDGKVGQHYDGNKVPPFGDGGQDTQQVTKTTESPTTDPEYANQPRLNKNTSLSDVAVTKSKGRGRGVLAARFGKAVTSSPLPGTAVKVATEEVKHGMKETQGQKLEAPEGTEVTKTDAKPVHPPPGFPPNYRTEMQITVNSLVTSQLAGKENTPKTSTVNTDTNERKQSDISFAEAPKGLTTQENNKAANDANKKIETLGEEAASDRTPGGNTSTETIKNEESSLSKVSSFSLPEAQWKNQPETVEPDLKEPSAETPSNKESTPKARKDGEGIPEDVKVPPRSPSLSESNEGRDGANGLNEENISKPGLASSSVNNKSGNEQKRNVYQQEDDTFYKDTSAGRSNDPNNQGTEKQKSEHHSSSPRQVHQDCEQNTNSNSSNEPDHPKDSTSEVDVSSTVTSLSKKEENIGGDEEQNSYPNIHCDNAETLEQQPVMGDSIEKTTLTSNGEEQKKKDFDVDHDEQMGDQMPPLSDVSEEDNRAVCPKHDCPSGDYTADQPIGYMTWLKENGSLPGFERSDTIIVRYMFPQGLQTAEHPNPGQPYLESNHEIYLPDTDEGREVFELLKIAFETRQLFTVKCSNISSQPGQIVWSDIPLKTSRTGGPSLGGYPDANYLEEVKTKLAAHGIVSSPK